MPSRAGQPEAVRLVDDRLLRPGAGQCPHLELGVALLGIRLARGDAADVAEQEAQRDRDDAGVLEGEKITRPTDAIRPPEMLHTAPRVLNRFQNML